MLRPFFYGDGTDHTVWLTEEEAWVVNNLEIYETNMTSPTSMYAEVNLTRSQMKTYNRAAGILNAYLSNPNVHVRYDDTSVPVLRPVS